MALAPGSSSSGTLARVSGGVLVTFAAASMLATVGLFGFSAPVLGVAVLFGSFFGLFGARLWKQGADASANVTHAKQQSVRDAASAILRTEAHTAPQLAEKLGVSPAEADAIASRLAADESTGVRAELDEVEGALRFSAVPRVRVVDPEEASAIEDGSIEAKPASRTGRVDG